MNEIKASVLLVMSLFLVAVGAFLLYIAINCYVWIVSHPDQMKPWYIGIGLSVLVIVLIVICFLLAFAWEWLQSKRLDNHEKLADIHFKHTRKLALVHAVESKANYKVTPDHALEVIHFLPPVRGTQIQEETQQQKILPSPSLQDQSLQLPGKCDFADILDIWHPSTQEILLALGPGGERVTVPVKALCHVALAGATGNGKSVIMRLLLSQLLFVGAKVILADPHYAPVDLDSGEDWRPIASRLMMDPAVQYSAIKDTLIWLAHEELPKRLERRRTMQPIGEPLFLAMDELPAIVSKVPEAPEYMAELLREGRKVGLYLVSAAQDWLVKTVGGTGGVRDCFRTAFYVGGDATTARVLLDVKGTVDDGGLGQGIVILRSKATPKASLIRVPYASNDALIDLLSVPSTAFPTDKVTANITAFPTARTQSFAVDEGALAVDAVKDTDPLQMAKLDARAVRIRELVKAQTLPSKIIEEVWGISAKQGGTAYAKAARELSAIMADLI